MTTEDIAVSVPSKGTNEPSMETQIIEEEERPNYNKIHAGLILFIFLQVCFLFTFSEPMTILWGGEPLIALYNDDIISRTARIIMIYHSLANPFIVATTFWVMEYFEIREKFVPSLKITLVPGALLSGICGLIFAYTRERFFHEVFYFGLFLIFLGGVIFMIAAFPIPGKFPDPKKATEGSLLRDFDLENYSLVLLAFCVIVSVIYGAMAGIETFTNTIWFLDRPNNDAFLAEEVVKILLHDAPEEFVVSHLHIQLALLAAMITMIGYKLSEIKGKIYRFMLFLSPIGVLTISYGAWVLNHYLIWVGAGILIINTILLSLKGWWKISKDRYGERFESLSLPKKIIGVFTDPVMFSLYFIFMYAQIVVTMCGIIVGLQTREVYRTHEYVNVEYDFNVGHWHVLAVLLATLLILIAINHFKIKLKARKISGVLLGVGGFVAFSGANLYMLRTPDANGLQLQYITFAGVWILTIGFTMGVIQLVKAYRNQQKFGEKNDN
ncbi:MAG: hypothetical protein GY870_08900 [archaeon]|nr:hypothetical protein [archaeon]